MATSFPTHRRFPLPGLVVRCAALAGLFEGVAIVRYQVLQGELGRLPIAIGWLLALAATQVAIWLAFAMLASRRFETVGILRAVLLFWTLAVVGGRSLLDDRLFVGGWVPAIAGLLAVALLPARWWRVASGRLGEAVAYLAVIAIGSTSLLGLIPDQSHRWTAIVAFLLTTALVAVALVEIGWRWPQALAALLAVVALAAFGRELVRTRPAGPNVLFVLLDTTRRDHVPPFGDRVFDSTVAELAAGGVRFDQAVTVVPKTPESVASFWTGLYPHRHGVRGLYDRLAGGQKTLAERFRQAGYSTIGLIDNGWLTRGRGFGQGFERFRGYYELASPYGPWTEFSWWRLVDRLSWRRVPRFSPQTSARRLTDVAIGAVERYRDRRFFLYVHYFEPHWPYFPPPAEIARYGGPPDGRTIVNFLPLPGFSRGRLIFRNPLPEVENEKARRLYRGEVDDTLSEVRRLLASLDRLGLERDTIVVFTADHGHSLGEHHYYFHHGEFVYDDSVRIPLVLRWPGHIPSARVVAAQVRSIDVAPTLLHLAGIPGEGESDGRSLQRYWREPGLQDLPAFVESDMLMFGENDRRDLRGLPGKMRAIRNSRFKLILNPRKSGIRFELFDLAADPAELTNLVDDPAYREQLRELSKQLWSMIPPAERAMVLAAVRSGTPLGDEPPARRNDEEELRSLGYIN
jgi:arylsulfatase